MPVPQSGNLHGAMQSSGALSGGITYLQGPVGPIGPTGNGIQSTTLNPDYTLTIQYTNGSTYTTEPIRGAAGTMETTGDTLFFIDENGALCYMYHQDEGESGYVYVGALTAYGLAVKNGFVGTEAEWLASLVGTDGANYSIVANALRSAISGATMRVNDVSPLEHNLSGIKQYGQCIQDGTPTPSAPIPITGKAAGAAIGDGTAITQTLTVTDANGDPVTLYGVPVSSDGNITIDGQQYVADTIEGNILTRRIAKFDIGGRVYALSSENATRKVWQVRQIPDIQSTTSQSDLTKVMCEAFTATTYAATWIPGTICEAPVGSKVLMVITDTSYSTLDDVNTALGGVMLYYALDTPTTEIVTLSPETLTANSPTTTWLSEAYSEATYNRDINAIYNQDIGLTGTQQAQVRKNIGAERATGSYELIETITLTDDVFSVVRTETPNGTPYNFKAALLKFNIATATAAVPIYIITAFYIGDDTRKIECETLGGVSATYREYFYHKILKSYGYWDAEASAAVVNDTTSMTKNTPWWRSIAAINADTYPAITKIEIKGYGTENIPAGSIIQVFGVV